MEALHEGPPSGIYYTRSHDWFRRVGGHRPSGADLAKSYIQELSAVVCIAIQLHGHWALESAARDQDVSVEAVLRRTFIHLQASQKPRAINQAGPRVVDRALGSVEGLTTSLAHYSS